MSASDAPPVFRFAPSPNGALHLGHAYSALLGAAWARSAGGRFLLRIEDIDLARARPEHERAIFEDLAWLGLAWEEPVRRQSEHFDDYRAALDRLSAAGLVYPCFATRREIAQAAAGAARDPDGAPVYPGLWRGAPAARVRAAMASGAPYALRLDMERALAAAHALGAPRPAFTEEGEGPDGETGTILADPAGWGDIVIARKEVPASYHLAVVVDDAIQGVSHVTRGRDLFHATSVQRLLQVLIGLPAPRYRHHRLVRDAAGRKLSKSAADTGLRTLRAAGVTPADIRARLGL